MTTETKDGAGAVIDAPVAPETQAADSAEATAPDPSQVLADRDAEIERLRQEVEREKHRADSTRLGPLLERIERMEAGTRRLEREIRRGQIRSDEEMDPAEKQRSLAQLSDEERQESETAQFMKYATRLANRLTKKMRANDLDPNSEAFKGVLATWQASATHDTLDDAYEQFEDAIDAQIAAKRKQESDAKESDQKRAVEDEVKRRLEAAGVTDMSGGRPAGGAGRETLESLSRKDTRRMTPQQLREHEKALDEALRGR